MATFLEQGELQQTAARPWAHLRATAEERAYILSSLVPFDGAAWNRDVTPATREELSAQEEFLQEREVDSARSLEREMGQMKGLAG